MPFLNDDATDHVVDVCKNIVIVCCFVGVQFVAHVVIGGNVASLSAGERDMIRWVVRVRRHARRVFADLDR